jgi:hypothetical protein
MKENMEINMPITSDEIEKAVKMLKKTNHVVLIK